MDQQHYVIATTPSPRLSPACTPPGLQRHACPHHPRCRHHRRLQAPGAPAAAAARQPPRATPTPHPDRPQPPPTPRPAHTPPTPPPVRPPAPGLPPKTQAACQPCAHHHCCHCACVPSRGPLAWRLCRRHPVPLRYLTPPPLSPPLPPQRPPLTPPPPRPLAPPVPPQTHAGGGGGRTAAAAAAVSGGRRWRGCGRLRAPGPPHGPERRRPRHCRRHRLTPPQVRQAAEGLGAARGRRRRERPLPRPAAPAPGGPAAGAVAAVTAAAAATTVEVAAGVCAARSVAGAAPGWASATANSPMPPAPPQQ